MMWRWAICFSLLPGLTFAATAAGKVTLVDPSSHGKDNSGVVVWLEPAAGQAEAKPSESKPKPGLTMVHKNKTFMPHVLAGTVGTKVSFPNRDPFFHNAFSNYDGQIFDIGLHGPGTTKELILRRPGVVRVFCNIHPNMSAVIVVLETPYFAVSDAAGNFTLSDVPNGDYYVKVFHERVAPAALKAMEHRINIGDDPVTLPPLSLSAAGYLETPHKNKVGKDYPAVIKDVYPGQVQ